MRSWIEAHCAKCEKPNLVNNGDTRDVTVSDVEGFHCWNCNANNEFIDEFGHEGEIRLSKENQQTPGHQPPE